MNFNNDASEFVYTRTYSRWIEEKQRRETWPETVSRYINFIKEERGGFIPSKVLRKIEEKILNFDVMPSMRALWSAGSAAKTANIAMYNCSALKIDSIEAFSELLYILCHGTGVGFSVESEDIIKLPEVKLFSSHSAKSNYSVEDSKEGWAESVRLLISNLYMGLDLDIDYSLIRPKGSRIKTFGGRSSGPEPLAVLHGFIRDVFNKAQERRLTSLECHDICCQIAEVIVAGGVRRSSLISLSNLNDSEMRQAKDWPFPVRRYMSNNSAIYYTKPSAVDFLKEWSSLASSGTGERGIFNIGSGINNSPERRNKSLISLTNPCSEILLRNHGFCNLSEVVIRKEDDLDSLMDKVESATWIGAIQSTFTDFKYLRSSWKFNADEERLLGVSLTGMMDNPELITKDVLKALKQKAIKVAKHAASKLGINVPVAITCVKPSGSVSQLVNSSSGIHARFSNYYIRRYRISSVDSLFKMIKAQGIVVVPDNGQEHLPEDQVSTWVLEFPVKAPKTSVTKDQMTALDQLELYKRVQTNWCEHSVSMTVYVKPEDWFEVGDWVYRNWDIVNGISFLPYDGGKYQLAPYEEITKEKYDLVIKEFKKIDYSKLPEFEKEDSTQGSKELACSSGVCEI